MASDLNVCTFTGRVGQDPETKADGKLKTFGLAVTNYEGPNNPEATMWLQVNLWGDRGKVAQYIRKGMKLTITGSLHQREYDGKKYYNVNVERVVLPDRSESTNGGYRDPAAKSASRSRRTPPNASPPVPDDDLPF